jgi:hypothetical protein
VEKKDKSHMIISTDKTKVFDKTEHPFLIRALKKTRNRSNTAQCNKAYSIHYNKWGKTESTSPKVKNETLFYLIPLLFNIILEFLAKAIRQEEKIKVI